MTESYFIYMEFSITETARRLDISERTVRRKLQNGELSGRQIPNAQGFVWMVELAGDEDSPDVAVTALQDMVTMLHAQVEADREELASKNKQIEQLHVLLQQQALALPAPKENRQQWWRFWGR